MKFAFYKYDRTKWNFETIVDRLICFATRGKYSHVEAMLEQNPDGSWQCASSTPRDGGVRIKNIFLKPEHWEIIDVDCDTQGVRYWFESHKGCKYDFLGILGFVIRQENGESNKYFCSEAIMESLGFDDAWRFDVSATYSILKGLNGTISK